MMQFTSLAGIAQRRYPSPAPLATLLYFPLGGADSCMGYPFPVFVWWVDMNEPKRTRWRRFRPELGLVSVAGYCMERPIVGPFTGILWVPEKEWLYGIKAVRYFGRQAIIDFWCHRARSSPWIYYSRNISTTNATV